MHSALLFTLTSKYTNNDTDQIPETFLFPQIVPLSDVFAPV